jgi:hypothetical protein
MRRVGLSAHALIGGNGTGHTTDNGALRNVVFADSAKGGTGKRTKPGTVGIDRAIAPGKHDQKGQSGKRFVHVRLPRFVVDLDAGR